MVHFRQIVPLFQKLCLRHPLAWLFANWAAAYLVATATANFASGAEGSRSNRSSALDQLDPAKIPDDERKFFFSREIPSDVVAVIRRPNWYADGVAFSADGRWFAACSRMDGPVEAPKKVPPMLLWNMAKLDEPILLEGHQRGIWSIAFSADSTCLAGAGRDTTVRLWDVQGEQPKPRSTLEGHKGWVLSASFTSDAKTLAAACGVGDGRVWLWELDKNPPQVRAKLAGYKYCTGSVAISPDGKLLACADHGTSQIGKNAVRVWNLDSTPPGRIAAMESGDQLQINTVAFSPDSKLLAQVGSGDTVKPVLRVWDVSGKEFRELPKLESPPRTAISLVFSPDGKSLAVGTDVWSIDGKLQYKCKGIESANSTTFSPDGRYLAVTSQGAIYIIRLRWTTNRKSN